MPAETLLLASGAGLLLLATLLPGDLLQLNTGPLALLEPWRLWTSQFCHWSPLHLAANLAALGGLWLVAGRALLPRLALLPLVAPLLSLGLLGVPGLAHYRGLSGLVAFLVGTLARDARWPVRLLMLGFGLKLGVDALSGTSAPSPFLPDTIQTTWQAHLGGLGLGLLAAWRMPALAHTAPDGAPSVSPAEHIR